MPLYFDGISQQGGIATTNAHTFCIYFRFRESLVKMNIMPIERERITAIDYGRIALPDQIMPALVFH